MTIIHRLMTVEGETVHKVCVASVIACLLIVN